MLYLIMGLIIAIVVLGTICYFVISSNGKLRSEIKSMEKVFNYSIEAKQVSSEINGLSNTELKERAQKWVR